MCQKRVRKFRERGREEGTEGERKKERERDCTHFKCSIVFYRMPYFTYLIPIFNL